MVTMPSAVSVPMSSMADMSMTYVTVADMSVTDVTIAAIAMMMVAQAVAADVDANAGRVVRMISGGIGVAVSIPPANAKAGRANDDGNSRHVVDPSAV